MILQVGDTLGTRYRIIKELEEGGFGKVFVAEDILKFDSKCVVKQFIQPYDEESEKGKKARALFHKEAMILCELENYPQVPNLLAFFEPEDCLVQELINGESLLNELEQQTFNENQVLNLLTQLLPVLREIHNRGIFHRDIKPGNIMRSGENDKLFLIDFGLAKQVLEFDELLEKDTNFKVPKSTNFGTSGYEAPESFSSPASDLYSLGATCFHLLTGDSPLYADERSWTNVEIEVKRETAVILKKLFEKELSARYQNAEEVLQDVKAIKDIQRREKIDFLLYLLNSTNDRYRKQAIDDLAEFGSYAGVAVPQLISFLQEDDFDLHSRASYTLGKIGEESVIPLAELLKHEKLEIRRRVATILKQIGVQAKAAIPQLIQALKDNDPDGEVQWYALIAIGEIGAPAQEAIPVLVEKLKDPKPGIRAWALYALGRMGDLAQEAESTIVEILHQEAFSDVFIAGIEALDSIGADTDEMVVTDKETNITIPVREWVLLTREKVRKAQEASREQARLEGRMIIEWRPALSPHTPPLKDPLQFRKSITVESQEI
ncbi:MAG TPA: HEAT repeat domain-containing protein [Kamptonema sp.]|nr:HEAT repeat domain-containing protein [Kamptonema sp.]